MIQKISSLERLCGYSQFNKWLTSCGGGSKSRRQAHQILSRVFKFFKFCCEDEEELSYEVVDFSLSSPTLLSRFVDVIEEEWKLQHAGRLGYLDSISEFIDFRKVGNPTEHVLRNLAITEVHLKKARRSISKMMRLQWVRDLDIETLEAKGHWATMAELVDVIAVNLPRYENILKSCRSNPETASPLDLSFATRFVAVYLSVKVKGSRPMTYQYLKVEMVEKAKKNGGFVDQKKLKTASKYGFDSLILSASSLQILESYISDIRPLLKPRCDYVLVTRSRGAQFTKLSNLMSKLVYDSIGKYVHPTRLRQIIETESSISLDRSEQEIISEDQKHSSVVAKVHYKKTFTRYCYQSS